MVKRLNDIDYVVNGDNVAKANELLTRFEERGVDISKLIRIYNLTFRDDIKYEIILNEIRSVLYLELKDKWFDDYYKRDWLDLSDFTSNFNYFKEWLYSYYLHLVLNGEINIYISPDDELVDCSLIKLNNLDPVAYLYDLSLEVSNLEPDLEISFEEENELLAGEFEELEDFEFPEDVNVNFIVSGEITNVVRIILMKMPLNKKNLLRK